MQSSCELSKLQRDLLVCLMHTLSLHKFACIITGSVQYKAKLTTEDLLTCMTTADA